MDFDEFVVLHQRGPKNRGCLQDSDVDATQVLGMPIEAKKRLPSQRKKKWRLNRLGTCRSFDFFPVTSRGLHDGTYSRNLNQGQRLATLTYAYHCGILGEHIGVCVPLISNLGGVRYYQWFESGSLAN